MADRTPLQRGPHGAVRPRAAAPAPAPTAAPAQVALPAAVPQAAPPAAPQTAPPGAPPAPNLQAPVAAPPAYDALAMPSVHAAGGRVTLRNLDTLRTTLSATTPIAGIGLADMPIRTLTLTVRAAQDRQRLAVLLEAMAAQLKA